MTKVNVNYVQVNEEAERIYVQFQMSFQAINAVRAAMSKLNQEGYDRGYNAGQEYMLDEGNDYIEKLRNRLTLLMEDNKEYREALNEANKLATENGKENDALLEYVSILQVQVVTLEEENLRLKAKLYEKGETIEVWKNLLEESQKRNRSLLQELNGWTFENRPEEEMEGAKSAAHEYAPSSYDMGDMSEYDEQDKFPY